MRVIEEKMIEAMRSHTSFKRDNTEVFVTQLDPGDARMGKRVQVFLHDNLIAELLTPLNSIVIRDGGWESVTTKSRLNVILNEYAPNYGIVQSDWRWYLVRRSGSMGNACDPWHGVARFERGIEVK